MNYSIENEEWLDLSRFPNYQVSSYGRIRNKRNGRILKPAQDRYGYLRVSIGNVDNVYIHRLVCETFMGPSRYCNAQVNHIDGNRQNNHIFNLEWCTPSKNISWGVMIGNVNPKNASKKARLVNLKKVRIPELNMIFASVKECAEYLNVAPTNVSRCLIGSRKGQKLHGYHIEYV